MADYCTCGAELPPDARFCHKCGKPQYEFPVPDEESEPDEPQVEIRPVVQLPPEINFRNSAAVRSGLVAAALASILMVIPMPPYLNMVWMLACLVGAGFFAVHLYRRRTGEELSTRLGARMGWITGVFCFLFAIILFTVVFVALSSQGGFADLYREQLQAQGANVDIEELTRILDDPSQLSGLILSTVIVLFIFSTMLPTLGGMMGAKVLEKD